MAFLRKFCLLFGLLLAVAVPARAATEARTLLPDSVRGINPKIVRSVQALRAEHLGKQIEVEIALRMRNYRELVARIANGEQIPQEQMAVKYLPLPADYNAVLAWAKAEGLTVTQTDPVRLGIFVKGTVAQLQHSFRAQFAEVATREGAFTAAITPPSLPASIATPVLGVNGLQPYIHPHHLSSGPLPQTENAPPYLVSEIKGAYGASNLTYTGSGETIAILIDAFPSTGDVQKFWNYNGIPQSLSNIQEIRAVTAVYDQPSGEETLDTEWTSGVAPGAKIRIYGTADLEFSDLDKGLQLIISDLPSHPGMHELSISLGLGETEVAASQKLTDSQYFSAIASYGVSIFVASGDDGATMDSKLQPSYYASDPNVTGVGGTSLYLYSNGAVEEETAWDGSGGGASYYFSRPAWQTGASLPTGTTRLVPDVAAAADPNTGAYIYFQGYPEQIGGTSWATPTWAGFCALINQARIQNGLGPLGLLNPKIYPLIGTDNFTDIKSGNNGRYSAGTGYDEVTGIGTPVMSKLLPTLGGTASIIPLITSFSPLGGQVGTSTTIYGANFDHVTQVEFGGGVTATLTATAAKTITAIVPSGAVTGPITLMNGTSAYPSSVNFTVVPVPPNDAFVSATVLSGSVGNSSGFNWGATTESGEPYDGGDSGGPYATVWWQWQSQDNGTYTFSTAGSTFDTTMGIYTGSAVNALTPVPGSDGNGAGGSSIITFTATAGATYYISVDGYQGAEGLISLAWAENGGEPIISNFTPQTGLPNTPVTITGAGFLGVSSVLFGGASASFNIASNTEIDTTVPTGAVTGPITVVGLSGSAVSDENFVVIPPAPNDNFSNAIQVAGANGSVTGNNEGATKQAGEPNIAGNAGGKSIWYSWSPPSTGPETITTFGSTFNTLLGVFTGTNVANLTPVAENTDYGNTVVSCVTFTATAGITYYIAVDGFNGASGNVVLNWAKDVSLPLITGFSPVSGPPATTISITGSNFIGATTVNLDSNPLTYSVISDSEISAVVPAGATSGLLSVGNLLGSVNSAAVFTVTASPTNDDFADAIPLAGANIHINGSNVGASRETNEPEINGNPGGASVWWSWTCPLTGDYAISTLGSDFSTLLGVFTGTAVDELTLVAQNEESPFGGQTSYASISATAGDVYQVAVDGLDGATGSITLNIYPQQASQDLYSTEFGTEDGFIADKALGGQQGWIAIYTDGTAATTGNGVTSEADGLSGQQAFVGYTPPSEPGDQGVFAYYPVDYSPAGTAEPIVTFTVTMAINDSSNGNYDDFQWQLYNSKGHNFFTIDFDNADLKIYYILDNEKNYVSTGVQFVDNTPMTLKVTMDYSTNKWSATLNGAPLITDKPIHLSNATFDFGDMDAVWNIFDSSNPGDNFMLFTDYSVVAGQDPSPSITFQPQSQTVVQGNPVTLDVVAGGEQPISYQWMLNNKLLPGEESASLTIPNAQPANAGTYAVTVKNPVGLIYSTPAKLVVTPLPMSPTFSKNPVSITVAAGATAVFTGSANAYPAPVYQWDFNGNPISKATATTLRVPKVQASSSGTYTLVASNSLGTGTSVPATLTTGSSFASEQGTFNGLVFNGAGDLFGSGLLKVTMGASGSFSGSLVLAGRTYRMAGSFSPEGTWQGVVGKTISGYPVTVSLQLSLMGAPQITGTALSGTTSETAAAGLDAYSRNSPPPEKPVYTLTLTGTTPGMPQGIGYATVTVDTLGNVHAAGRLGDYTPFSFSSVLSGSGSWPFYASLYSSGGYVAGTLTFEEVGQTDLDGSLFWMRPSNGELGGYSGGFAGDLGATGYMYQIPVKNSPPIAIQSGTLGFFGGVLGNSSISGTVSPTSTGSLLVSSTSQIKLSLTPKTGVFTGTISVPGISAPLPYGGVFIQKLDGGAGLFNSPTVSGSVSINAQ